MKLAHAQEAYRTTVTARHYCERRVRELETELEAAHQRLSEAAERERTALSRLEAARVPDGGES